MNDKLNKFLNSTKAKKIFQPYMERIFGADKVIKNLTISILQSYQDKESYNLTISYKFELQDDDSDKKEQHLTASLTWPRNNEYGYIAGKLVSDNISKKNKVKIPEYYLYTEEYNMILREYCPGISLTKIIKKAKAIEPLHLELLVKWLVDLQKIKPSSEIKNTIDFYNLENNLRILRQNKNSNIESLDKEYKLVKNKIDSWMKNESKVLTHGDFNPANILVNDKNLTVIDFENTHLGNPLADLANLSSYLTILLKNKDYTERLEKEIILLYEKYGKKLTAEEKNMFIVYKQYFSLLFKTHPMIWGS